MLRALLGSIGELTQIKSLFRLRLRDGTSASATMVPQLPLCLPGLQFHSDRRRRSDRAGGSDPHRAASARCALATKRTRGCEARDRWSPRLARRMVLICPGVSIDVGAYSFVVRDLPANVLAVGNPCKVIRQLYSPRKFVAMKFARRPAHETWWFQCLSASTTLRDLSLIQ